MALKKIYLPEQCYFITTNTTNRKWVFGRIKKGIYVPNEMICQEIIGVLNYTRKVWRYLLHSYVIMPDHLHLILTTARDKSPVTRGLDNTSSPQRVSGDSSPPTEANIFQIMHAIKGRSARLINKKLGKSGQFWQEDFYEHGIRNEKDFEEKFNYIHLNPVRANLVKDPEDFKYSSYRNYYLDDDSVIVINEI